MTINKRIDNSPAALPKTVAALRRDFEQEKASLGLRASTLTVGGEALIQRDGVLNFVDATGAERAVVPPPQVTLIPNADFEQVDATGFPLYWTKVAGAGVVDVTTDGVALSGSRALKVTIPATASPSATLYSEPFVIAPDSTITIDASLMGSVGGLIVSPVVVSNSATGEPTAGASGAVTTGGAYAPADLTWTGRTASITPPSAHTHARIGLVFSGFTAGVIRADAVNIQARLTSYAAYAHRAAQNLQGGGVRAVNADGRISWSNPFMASSPGGPNVYIPMPANATVIPVYDSLSRTSETVSGGFVEVLAPESLWYEIPKSGGTVDAAGNLRILSLNTGLDPAINERWIMICASSQGLLDPASEKFKWGDGRTQDPRKGLSTVTKVSDQTINSTTVTDLASLTTVRESMATAQVFVVDATLDTACGAAGAVFVGSLLVDGFARPEALVLQLSAGQRFPASRRWLVSGLTVGPHTFKLAGNLTAAVGNYIVYGTHSVLTIDALA